MRSVRKRSILRAVILSIPSSRDSSAWTMATGLALARRMGARENRVRGVGSGSLPRSGTEFRTEKLAGALARPCSIAGLGWIATSRPVSRDRQSRCRGAPGFTSEHLEQFKLKSSYRLFSVQQNPCNLRDLKDTRYNTASGACKPHNNWSAALQCLGNAHQSRPASEVEDWSECSGRGRGVDAAVE